MSLQQLLDWVKAEPFRPFRMRLADGGSVDVASRERIWPEWQVAVVGFVTSDDQRVYERHQIVGLANIVAIDPIPHQDR